MQYTETSEFTKIDSPELPSLRSSRANQTFGRIECVEKIIGCSLDIVLREQFATMADTGDELSSGHLPQMTDRLAG